MKRWIFSAPEKFLPPLLSAFFLIIALFILNRWSPGLIFGPATPSPSPTPSITTTITSTLNYGDALKTYENVATSAILASEKALEMIKWVVGAVLGLIAVATTVAIYLSKAARDASTKAKMAEEAAKDARAAADTAKHQLSEFYKLYVTISQQYLELKSQTLSLDAVIHARERGEIGRERQIEAEQGYSWYKWTVFKNELGWKELKARMNDGEILMPAIRTAVEMELMRLEQQGTLTDKEQEYEKRLRFLLRKRRH